MIASNDNSAPPGAVLDPRWIAMAFLGLGMTAGGIAGAALTAPSVAAPPSIEAVNSEVNQSHRWGSPIGGLTDYGGDGVFDCEDYAWTKYVLLRRQGLPADDMAVVRVRYPSSHSRYGWNGAAPGDDHVVLVVRTVHGLRVLDNRYPMVTSPTALERVGYVPYDGWWPNGVPVPNRGPVLTALVQPPAANDEPALQVIPPVWLEPDAIGADLTSFAD